jgi:hypothetical protein
MPVLQTENPPRSPPSRRVFVLAVYLRYDRDDRFVGGPPALSPSLAGPFNIGNRKGRRFCNANCKFAT